MLPAVAIELDLQLAIPFVLLLCVPLYNVLSNEHTRITQRDPQRVRDADR